MPTDQLPKVDLTKPECIVLEIFDDDKWVKDRFSAQFSAELLEFAEAIAGAFKRYPELESLIQGHDEQALYVHAFVHGIFDDLITSTKLLVTGKMIASGNLMRQTLEGIAIAILCSYRGLLLIPDNKSKKQQTIPVKYWELVKANDRRVVANKSLAHLNLNYSSLGVAVGAIDEFKRAIKIYNLASHPSLFSLVARINATEKEVMQFVGGVFNDEMIPVYRHEIVSRTNLCKILPSVIGLTISHLKSSH